jgi:hypothetical protein
MAQRWLSARMYYSPLDVTAPGDPQGETILRDFLQPALAYMREQGWIEWATFMRFSEAGYHIYLTVFGEKDVLTGEVQPYLQREFIQFRQAHPEIMQQPMELSPNAATLNRKWGSPSEPRKLRAPGTVVTALMVEHGDAEGYESEAAWLAHQRLHTALCQHTLELLNLDPAQQFRLQLVRLLMDDFFSLSGLTPPERYTVLRRLRQSWIDYFELTSEVLGRIEGLYQRKEDRYRQFFAHKQRPDDSLDMIPAPLRPVYATWLKTLRELAPAIIQRADEENRMTVYDAQRVLGVFHLTHNRLSIKLEDEILTAHILAQHYGSLIAPEKRAEMDSNLSRKSQASPSSTAAAGE